jgi:hypothetical protein
MCKDDFEVTFSLVAAVANIQSTTRIRLLTEQKDFGSQVHHDIWVKMAANFQLFGRYSVFDYQSLFVFCLFVLSLTS